MDERIEFLRLHDSTRGLDDEEVQALGRHVQVVYCHEGEVIHHPNQPTEALWLVVNGQLTVSAVSPQGHETTLQYIGHDDQFGLLALNQDDVYPIRVTASHNTRLLKISKDDALQFMRDHQLWGRNMLKSTSPRIINGFLNKKQRANQRLIAIVHDSDASRKLTSALIGRLAELGENVGLLSDDDAPASIAAWQSESLKDATGQTLRPEDIRRLLADWQVADRIIVDMSLQTAIHHLTALTDACESVFWVTGSSRMDDLRALLKPLVANSPAVSEKLFSVRMLTVDERVAPLITDLQALCAKDFKVHWDDMSESPVLSRRAGIERIVHHLRGVTIGLALGGGAARGMAHLGVLQILEKAGIVIDCLSGTSAGSLTGIPYAAGYTADFLVDAFAHDLLPPWYYRWLPYGDAWFMLGKYRLGGWDGMLRKYLFDWRLEQLAVPFSAVTVDLVQARQVICEIGDATHAILESINLPWLARPICRDSMALVDGGILNVVPADALANQDANVVISSDVAARIRFEFVGNRPDTPTEQMKVPTSMQTAVRIRTVQDRNIRSMGGSWADVIIEPDVSKVELTDFKRAPKIAALGRAATEASLPEIRRVLNQMDTQLFPD